MRPRIRDAGDSALLLELEPVLDAQVNARAIAIAGHVRSQAVAGVRDVVSTFRSVAVYFDPLQIDVAVVREALQRAASTAGGVTSGRTIEVPVVYGGDAGPDLDEVAARAGLTPQAVIERHTSAAYRAFMLGFLPGFAYLGPLPAEIAAPRRATPRLRVPAGSVGIAGRQTAVYPNDSPGGWQIIGRTSLPMFDSAATRPALIAPGDTVRFRSVAAGHRAAGLVRPADADVAMAESTRSAPRQDHNERSVTVVRPGLFTTIQDRGRWSHQSSGVPVSGAMDLPSHRTANGLVGNPPDAATLEATLVGPELRVDTDTTVAVSGADLSATINGTAIPLNQPARCRTGSLLRFGERKAGTRAYVAFDGGLTVAPVLGSRATHALTRMGGLNGRPVAAGDRLPLGTPSHAARGRRVDAPRVTSGGGARVRVLPGPQDDWFSGDAFDTLQRSRFTISVRSDRMGYRLEGARIPHAASVEMISDATFTGAIQVPASGEPILLMADRQTTGGYPQIAIVITADLPVAAQLAPGDWIEFQICTRADALGALVGQEGKLLALG